MRRLAVDFRSESRPPLWAWAAVGLLAIVAIALVIAALIAERRLQERQAELSELLQRLAASRAGPPPSPPKMPYDASAREFLALATSQWPAMLVALESVEIVGVTPVSIDVSPAERLVRVDVEFSDYAALLKYVDALNAGETSSRWALLQAQVASRGPAAASGPASIATLRASW